MRKAVHNTFRVLTFVIVCGVYFETDNCITMLSVSLYFLCGRLCLLDVAIPDMNLFITFNRLCAAVCGL
jgi:hypothetical protein